MLTQTKLEILIKEILPLAQRAGLECPHIHFELVDAQDIHALASYHGLPVRYAHWSFGKTFGRLKTAYDYRMSQIYELVINARPFYAFIDRSSTDAQALLIVAHVLAHVDYFSHSRLFSTTTPNILHQSSWRSRRIADLGRIYGNNAVESLLDAAWVLGDHVGRIGGHKEPAGDPSDILGFVAINSRVLEEWERQVLLMVRDESRYFWPQRLSKINNEGYATFWHTRLTRELSPGTEITWQIAHLNSRLLATTPPRLNPYALGARIYERLYQQHGITQVMAARNLLDDAGLIRIGLDEHVIRHCRLDVFREQDSALSSPYAGPEQIKTQLLQDVEHAGVPYLSVSPRSREEGSLIIEHHFDGRDLDFYELPFALKAVSQRLWGGLVQLHTIKKGVHHIASHNGSRWADEVV
ncbi:MAG: stage V sporulation protein R [Sulfobacillus benefaciens]|uniref:Stage V sporulation protein R n=1 Tax=Sulfobacillus benefaciens TaxID=453960 RepID=A0A2T2X6U3_9FIRM|nr:MAG: stage V sporulation protein R [Sulfobacillus benefaciens]